VICTLFIHSILIAIGRAGRDGLPSKAVLLYKSDDVNRLRFIMNKDNANDDGRPDFMLSQEDQEVYNCIYMCVYILLQYELITRLTGYKLYRVCGT
jgi:superfamily II DNA helicase RecQ